DYTPSLLDSSRCRLPEDNARWRRRGQRHCPNTVSPLTLSDLSSDTSSLYAYDLHTVWKAKVRKGTMTKSARSFSQQIMHCLVLLLALSSLYGCGAAGGERASSSSLPSPPSHSLSVTVAPLAVEVRAGDAEQFSATVSGDVPAPAGDGFLPRSTSASQIDRPEKPRPGPIHPAAATTGVIWSVNGVLGGNAAVGTISANGLYHSPPILPTPNAVDVTASSVANPSVSQTALLTLYNPIPTV